MKKYDIVKMIKEYLIVTLGVILVSFGLQYFYAPNDIAGGGLSGLALVINHYVPFLSTGTLVFLGNLILFVIAFLLIGSDFGANAIARPVPIIKVPNTTASAKLVVRA